MENRFSSESPKDGLLFDVRKSVIQRVDVRARNAFLVLCGIDYQRRWQLKGNVDKESIFIHLLLEWFSSNARDFPWRKETDPYRILVAEKLLQQTTYGHVLKVYDVFFERFPNPKALAEAEVSHIENTIRRLGFQRQRARQFKKIGSAILNERQGKIPLSKEDLLKLNGIGNYVANAVLCFAFNKDVAIVDMNVRRVVGRYFGWRGIKDKEIEKRLSRLIPEGQAKQFNWGIIDFSGLICSRKPKCKMCFLNDLCSYFQESKVN